jgi:VWFA-related protein
MAPVQQPSASTPDSDLNQFPATPTLHVTAHLVELDVVVVDGNGNPVRGLKPSDFTLSEDGVSQHLNSFTEHQATPESSPTTSEPSLPPNTFTVHPPLTEEGAKTVIVIANLHYPNHPLVRGDIEKFMRTVAPGNPIAIIRLDWLGLHLVQGFTSDPQLLQEAVASSRMLPPLPPLNVFPWTGCRLPYQGVANPYHRLASYLAGIPGRINLALVSDEGKPDDFRGNEYPELSSIISNLNGSTDVLRPGRVVPYAIKAGGYVGGMLQPYDVPEIPIPQIIPGSHAADDLADCPLMPAAQGGLLANQDMADMGGHAFFDGADKALSQIMALGSNYYTLSYVPTNPKWNGAYRKIAIKVSGIPQVPRSLLGFGWSAYGQPNVLYRNGYFARLQPDPSSQSGSTVFGRETAVAPASKPIASSSPGVVPISAASPNVIPRATSAMEAAMGFGTLTPNQVKFTIKVTPSTTVEKRKTGRPPAKDNFLVDAFRDVSYRNYKVHYWIDPTKLRFSRTANGSYRDDLQFVAIVYRDDGLVANSVSVTAHIQVPANDLKTILATGVTFDQTFAIPIADKLLSQNYFLRVAVNETSTGHIGALEVPTDWIQLPSVQIDHPLALAGR